MLTITLDAETFYSKDYSLRKMTPIEYILGDQYETIGWGVAVGDKDPVWLEGDRVAKLLQMVNEPWMAITHNALFDCCILAYRYDIHPTLMVDTMSMARALLTPRLPGGQVKLSIVAEHLGLGAKNSIALGNVTGMHLAEIKSRYETHYLPLQAYCVQDVVKTRGIYRQLSSRFPAKQHLLNHMVIRMASRPTLAVDVEKLYAHQNILVAAKASLMERANVTKLELMSDDKFALALQAFGVDPPRKISPKTGKEAWAFAKTDEGMEELAEHDDPDVQALVAARVGVKSTLEESRTQRFINIASATFDGKQSWMPIPLRFSGAHTHRASGDWKLNLQNLPSRKSTNLRQSLVAPPGRIVLAVDASQIEARLTAWLCGCDTLTTLFANKQDVYSSFASDIYKRTVTKRDKPQRFLGKTSILGLGFGMGPPKFENAVRIQAADQGIALDLADVGGAEYVVKMYRWKYPQIPKGWRYLDGMIQDMHAGRAEGVKWGPVTFHNDRITLPGGLELFYPELQYDRTLGWSYWSGHKRKRIWGGTMLENIVQALDWCLVMDAAIRIEQRLRALGIDLWLSHQVHDELIYVPLIQDAEQVRAICAEEMSYVTAWASGLPLAAETKLGPNYGSLEEDWLPF